MLLKHIQPLTKHQFTISQITTMNERDCKEHNELYNPTLQTRDYLILNNTEKTKLILSVLNEDQRSIVYKFFEIISCTFNASSVLTYPTVILLDAPSGTGKSFLIDCMYLCMRYMSIVVVARNKVLLNKIFTMEESAMMKSLTTCKFMMKYFGLKYEEAIGFFNNENFKSIDDIDNLLSSVLNKKISWDFNFLILDEYSMESPILLILLVLIAKRENVNVLIIGDIKQQNTLTPCDFHPNTNYSLLNVLGDKLHRFKLNEQMRIKDKKLNTLINDLKLFIANDETGNVPNCFAVKYCIFLHLKYKFMTKSSKLKDIYLADTHRLLKARVQSIKNHVDNYVEEKFELDNRETKERSFLSLPDNDKFMPHLLLVPGACYMHTKSQFVTLMHIDKEKGTLKIKNNKTGTMSTISKIIWNKYYHECVDSNYSWLSSFNPDPSTFSILQYPLRPCTFTYYFIQGLTFSENNVCMNIDSATVNSLYVGFSRVNSLDQIVEVQSRDFLSLLYTSYKNDDYFYKIINPKNELVDHLQKFYLNVDYKFDDSKVIFKEIDSSIQFEKRNVNYMKMKKVNNLKRQTSSQPIAKKQKCETSELSKLFVSRYAAKQL